MSDGFSGYAIVEVMGHNRYVGLVAETTLAGAGMLRVDVPEIPATETRPGERGYTKYIPPTSLYALTPISEEEFLRMREPAAPRRYLQARYEDPWTGESSDRDPELDLGPRDEDSLSEL